MTCATETQIQRLHINPTKSWERMTHSCPSGQKRPAVPATVPRPRAPLLLAACFRRLSPVSPSLNMMLWQNSTAPDGKAFLAAYQEEGTCVWRHSGLFSVQQTRVRAPSATCGPPRSGGRKGGEGVFKGPGDMGGWASGEARDRQEGTRGRREGQLLSSGAWDLVVRGFPT